MTTDAQILISFLLPIVLAIIGGIITLYKDREKETQNSSPEKSAVAEAHIAEASADKTKYETVSLLVQTLREQISIMREEQFVIKSELKNQCMESENMAKEFKERLRIQGEDFEKEITRMRVAYESQIELLKKELMECFNNRLSRFDRKMEE